MTGERGDEVAAEDPTEEVPDRTEEGHAGSGDRQHFGGGLRRRFQSFSSLSQSFRKHVGVFTLPAPKSTSTDLSPPQTEKRRSSILSPCAVPVCPPLRVDERRGGGRMSH